jgi:hypothetical protein
VTDSLPAGDSAKSATPSSVDSLRPTPVADFERRLQICKAMGVSHLKDGQLEVIFLLPPRPRASLDELMVRNRAALDGEEG